MKNKFLIAVFAVFTVLMACSSFSALAIGLSLTDYHQSHQLYNQFTEDFAPSSGKPSNTGTWSYNGINAGMPDFNNGVGSTAMSEDGYTVIRLAGSDNFETSHPSLGTHQLFSPYTGDYFQKGVISLSIEARVMNELIFNGHNPMTLVLRGKDGFTLYKTMQYCEPAGRDINCPGVPPFSAEWVKYTFQIPDSVDEAVLNNWGVYNLHNMDTKYSVRHYYSQILANVEKVDFMLGAPHLIYGLQLFAIDARNPTVVSRKLAQSQP